jgi:tRNA-Thr(GGU) m(6)t(6)A37 methyltransferase TsaA
VSFSVEPIGIVKCDVQEGVDENWGEVVSELHFAQHLEPGLVGLEHFSHVLVLFWMHQSTFAPGSDLVRRPRGRADMPELGIFAQRAKHRPNPIAVTAVRLLTRRGNILHVKGLDAIDGTPIIDVKPYFPAFDSVDQPNVPDWVDELMKGYF